MAEESQGTALHFLDYWRVIRDRKDIILAVALLTIVTGTLSTFMTPQKFRATTQIQVSEDSLDVDPFYMRQSSANSFNPFFLLTQEKIIRSRRVLTAVVRTLNLPVVWGMELNDDKSPITPEMALQILQSSLRVEQDRDTLLMNISVTTENPQRSAEIANAIATEYRRWRYSEEQRVIQQAVDALGNELRKQQQQVEAAENKLEQIRKEHGISIVGNATGISGTGIRADHQRISHLEGLRSSARVDMMMRKARLSQLENLEGVELMEAASYIVQDPTLIRVRSQLLEAQVQLELMLKNGVLGPGHPDVKRVQAAVDELQNQLQSLLGGLKAGLRADYEASLAQYNALEEELSLLKEKDIEDISESLLIFNRAEQEVLIQRDILTALRARITQTGIELGVPRTTVRVIEEAIPPQRPSSPLVFLNIFLSVVLGFMAGIGLAFFVEYLDVSIKTVDEVEKFLGLSVLSVIPQQMRPLTDADHSAGHGESYRALRTSLILHARDKGLTTFTTISGGVGEGKSTTLFNLAYVFAEQGSRVLIVDSDLRRPVQHKLAGVSNKLGLVNVLMEEMEPMEAILPTKVANLSILPSGRLRRGTLGILNGQRIHTLLEKLKDQFDYIFFDSPPILGVTDAAILASEVEGVLLVVQYRKYPKNISIRAKRMIEAAGGNLIGVVLNNINITRDDYYYYYHYSTKKYYGRLKSHEEDAIEGDS